MFVLLLPRPPVPLNAGCSMFEDKLKSEATLQHFGSPFHDPAAVRSSFRPGGDSAAGEPGPKSGGKGRLRNSMRRASAVALAATGAGDKMGKTKAEIEADMIAEKAKKEALAKELKREAGQLSTKIVKYSETMMRFGLRACLCLHIPMWCSSGPHESVCANANCM